MNSPQTLRSFVEALRDTAYQEWVRSTHLGDLGRAEEFRERERVLFCALALPDATCGALEDLVRSVLGGGAKLHSDGTAAWAITWVHKDIDTIVMGRTAGECIAKAFAAHVLDTREHKWRNHCQESA